MTSDRFVRPALALAVATMGVVNLLSALLSHPPERLVALRHLVPTAVLDSSRTFTLLAGVLLVVTALGLARGKRRAYVVALLLCALSVPVNTLKAFDFEEATVAAALMFALGVNASAFAVKSREPSLRGLRSPAALWIASVIAYSVIGCWIVELRFGHGPASLGRALAEAGHQLLGVGQPVLDVPRAQHVVRWFLGSIPVLALTVLGSLGLATLRPARHRARHRAERARVAELAARYGAGAVSAYVVDEANDFFFSRNARAVIAYRWEHDVLLVVGDALGPPEEIPPLLEDFERYSREHDWTFAFYQAGPDQLPEHRARGWHALHVGVEPVLRPGAFGLEGAARGNLRRAVNRLVREGLVVEHWIPGERPFDAAHDAGHLLDALREISGEWLQGRVGGEKGFCMGRFDPGMLDRAWLSVVRRGYGGRVEAFCTWTPVPARHGWGLDLMRRRADAPGGVMEFAIATGVQRARERGDAWMSLSLSALARAPHTAGECTPPAPESAARDFIKQRLGRFYDFDGLFQWKRKFDPEFEDRYLVYPEPLALPRIALALVRAQSPAGLLSYVLPPPRHVAPPGDDAGAPE